MDRIRAYAQLLRLPNVFTAWADVAMGVLIAWQQRADASGTLQPADIAVAFAASTCFYWAGMVLNDFFDASEDARDRPFRPIPSGRVSRRAARWLGTLLLVLGLMLAISPAATRDDWTPHAVGLFLATLILLYNAWAKRTIMGPFIMGGCRFLHVLLAVSLARGTLEPWIFGIAGVVGGYIAVVTLVARNEAHFPRIQRAVKWLLFGLIGLDACLAFIVVGWPGLFLLLLLPPALILGKWVYST